MTKSKITLHHREHMNGHTVPSGAQRKKNFEGTSGRRVGLIPIDQLKPHMRNARKHSVQQINRIARSIEQFGFTNPILIDRDNGVIAGHGRIEAAKQVGLSAVPALRIDHLNAAAKRAYVIADNRLAELAGWDRETLTIELQELSDIGYEVELTGSRRRRNQLHAE